MTFMGKVVVTFYRGGKINTDVSSWFAERIAEGTISWARAIAIIEEETDTSNIVGRIQADFMISAIETLLGDSYFGSPEEQRETKSIEIKVRRKYKATTDLKGIDTRIARRVVDNLDVLFAEYPKMIPHFQCLSTVTNKRARQSDGKVMRAVKADAAAWDWGILMSCTSTVKRGEPFGFGITINPSNFRRMETTQRILDTMEEDGSLPKGCNSVEALVTHEFGHAMLRKLMLEAGDSALHEIEMEISEAKRRDTLLDWQSIGEVDAEEIWADTLAAIRHAPPESLKDSMLAKTVRDNMRKYRYLYE